MSRKKIVFVINSMVCGGAEKSLVSLLPLIDYDKYDVDLQMFTITGEFLKLIPNQVNVLPELPFYKFLHSGTKNQMLLLNARYLKARVAMFSELRKNAKLDKPMHDSEVFWKACHNAIDNDNTHYDYAIAWGQGNPTHYVAEKVNADKKFAWINADYVLTGHSKEFDFPYYEKFDKIVAVSEKLEIMLKETFNEFSDRVTNVLDIQNAVLIKQMSQLKDDDLPDKTSDKVRLVTVGRLQKLKGYDLAVEAAKILADNGLNFEWYFLGEGNFRATIEKMIADYNLQEKVKLVGSKSNPYPFVDSADIYVQTSRHEGYCLTLAEARTLNKPIVSTNFDVVYDQLVNEKNGLIVEMNGQAIADGIIRLINDTELRNNIVEHLKTEKKGNIEEFNKFKKLLEG